MSLLFFISLFIHLFCSACIPPSPAQMRALGGFVRMYSPLNQFQGLKMILINIASSFIFYAIAVTFALQNI